MPRTRPTDREEYETHRARYNRTCRGGRMWPDPFMAITGMLTFTFASAWVWNVASQTVAHWGMRTPVGVVAMAGASAATIGMAYGGKLLLCPDYTYPPYEEACQQQQQQ